MRSEGYKPAARILNLAWWAQTQVDCRATEIRESRPTSVPAKSSAESTCRCLFKQAIYTSGRSEGSWPLQLPAKIFKVVKPCRKRGIFAPTGDRWNRLRHNTRNHSLQPSEVWYPPWPATRHGTFQDFKRVPYSLARQLLEAVPDEPASAVSQHCTLELGCQ